MNIIIIYARRAQLRRKMFNGETKNDTTTWKYYIHSSLFMHGAMADSIPSSLAQYRIYV